MLRRILSVAPLVVGLVFALAACMSGAGGTSAPSGSSPAPASGAAATPTETPATTLGATAIPGASAAPVGSVAGTSWNLAEIDDQPVAAGVEATIAFGADGQATGSGGCNTFNGPYTVDGISIKIGPLAATMMACPEPQMTVEASYFAALDKVTMWQVPQDVPITQGPLVLTGPGGQPRLTFASAAPAAAGLSGTSWVLAGLGNLPLPGKVQVTAQFGTDGTVSGNAGCNSYNGSYTVNGGSIIFGPIVSTKMACPEAQMAVETAYLAALGTAATWSIGTDGRLSISGPDGKAALVFDPAAGLAGTSWMLTQQDGKPVAAGVTVTARFGADGNVSGSGGCNNYNGSYTVDGGSITIGSLASTEMACPEPQMAVETAYLAALGKATAWTIDSEGKLSLTGADAKLSLVFTSAPLAQ